MVNIPVPSPTRQPDRDLSAACPKCQSRMIYVTAIPHPQAPQMHRTTFVCYPCNQTRSYSLSAAMAAAYAELYAPPEPDRAASGQ